MPDPTTTAASIPYEGTDCTPDEAVEAVEAVRATAATEKAAYSPDGATPRYGTAEHAVAEAIVQSIYTADGWVTAEATSLADVVLAGLRERGFAVHREPRCECGWTGEHNHYHDSRMGRAQPGTSTSGQITESNHGT